MKDKELFNLIISYFPQYKDDESLSPGGYVYELPYLTFSEILFNHVLNKEEISEEDADSFPRFINEIWNKEPIIPEISFLINDSILDHIMGKKNIISKIKLEGDALKMANQHLANSPHSAGIFFS